MGWVRALNRFNETIGKTAKVSYDQKKRCVSNGEKNNGGIPRWPIKIINANVPTVTTVDKEETLATMDRAVVIPIGERIVQRGDSKDIMIAGKDSKSAGKICKTTALDVVKISNIKITIWAIPMTATTVVE
ncbi:MAG TPA: hypothetical protein ENI28_08175 [Roseobacter sp.]|nr:hypothetical protein [Roseobacter sp.]|tara:strand:+ start:882 stop:1274 length:393 start_codon:yes stop_codon:yes gene_type:complete